MPNSPVETPSRASSRLVAALRWLVAGDAVFGASLLLLVAYYVATRGVFQGKASGDGYFGFEYLRAIVWKHTLDMKSVLPEYLPYFSTSGPFHRMPNRCPFGPVLLWMPFYLVGCGLHALLELAHLVGPGRGDEPFYSWAAGLGTLVPALLGWRALYVLIERNVGRTAARLGAITAVWATPMAWYLVTQPLYQHGLAFAFVALLVEAWDRSYGELRVSRFIWLGVLGGLAMEMREQEALYLLLPGGEILLNLLRGPRRKEWLVGGVALAGAAALAFVPQLAVFYYYTGTLSPPQVEPLRWSTPFIVVVLFSTRGGLFSWSPIAYASTVGLLAARRARRLVWSLAAVFALEVYVVACAWVLTSGYAYGARRLSDGAVLLGLGVALAYDWLAERRAWRRMVRLMVVAFAALCIVLNLCAMELVRARRVASSGGYARTAARWLEEAKAPPTLSRLFERVGYPFVQPVGWLFALYHHAPVSTFEGVVGNFILDRDGQWFTILNKTLNLDAFNRANQLDGLALPANPKDPAKVVGPVRLLLSMFASEPISVQVVGAVAAGALAARWNGEPVKVERNAAGLRFDLQAPRVRAGINELALDVPLGSTLTRLDFAAPTQFWK